jgi:hypothetical protein
MNTSPIVKKKINHDSMWISCTFPSGGWFKYRITRYSKELEVAFSNNTEELKTQRKVFYEWLNVNSITSYGDMFEKLQDLCLVCNTGKELITLMNKNYES